MNQVRIAIFPVLALENHKKIVLPTLIVVILLLGLLPSAILQFALLRLVEERHAGRGDRVMPLRKKKEEKWKPIQAPERRKTDLYRTSYYLLPYFIFRIF